LASLLSSEDLLDSSLSIDARMSREVSFISQQQQNGSEVWSRESINQIG